MAERINNVGASSYKIKVTSGGDITLDVGNGGKVTVSGDLDVQGQSTSIGSSELIVEDNTITLNNGETGAGISLGTSGLIIDRGTRPDANVIFDESLQTIVGGTAYTGSWALRDQNGAIQGLYASSIRPDPSSANNLTLLGSGSSIVTVTGTTDYEKNLYPYTGSAITPNPSQPNKLSLANDDDALVNAKLMEDYILGFYTYNFQNRIDRGESTKTFVQTYDFEEDATTSRIEFGVDGTNIATMFENRFDIGNLSLSGGSLTSQDTNGDVELKGSGTGVVKITTPTTITQQSDPAVPTDGISLYSKPLADGGTGLFFVNQDSTQDEIASRNKALLFSIIF